MEQSLNELSKENAQSFHKIDFENTRIAFSTKTDKELKDMYRLFSLMNSNFFVKAGSKLGLFALKLKLPFVESIIRATIFKQFCGGVNLLDCQGTIDELYRNDSLTILDYGAEGKSEEHELDAVMEETMRAIEFAASNNSVPVVSTKLTGMVANKILRKLNAKEELNEGENREYQMLLDRINKVAKKAFDLKVGLFVDAEESWLQDPIDDIVMDLMSKFNREKVIIYNTYQLYRKDKLEDLKQHHSLAKEEGFMLGAKLVRGAYMEKERNRAKELGYPSPIHETKDDTDKDFDAGIEYCIRNYETIASCCASHNVLSNARQAEIIYELGLEKDHPHFNFCQLYGMSDYITFNIGTKGYNVAKYVPYGPIKEVIPYLIRRAEENTSVTGEMSRELGLIYVEMQRRGMIK